MLQVYAEPLCAKRSRAVPESPLEGKRLKKLGKNPVRNARDVFNRFPYLSESKLKTSDTQKLEAPCVAPMDVHAPMGDENKVHSNRDVSELTGKLANRCTLSSATKGSHEHGEDLNPVTEVRAGHDGTDNQGGDPRSQELLQSLETFFAAPEFTTFVREFVQDNSSSFIVTEEDEEQPLR
jgi:hypothetical protein